jgi:hypothetical protein
MRFFAFLFALLPTLLLFGPKAGTAGDLEATDQEAAQLCKASDANMSTVARRPPTHMQRCQAACRGIKGASAHSRCIHNCMSRR